MTDEIRMKDSTTVQSPTVPVEELPLAERVKFADSVNPYNGIAPGWYIDARDTINNWCVAEVLKVEGNDVKVSYDGWSSKYDDVRIQFERMHNRRFD